MSEILSSGVAVRVADAIADWYLCGRASLYHAGLRNALRSAALHARRRGRDEFMVAMAAVESAYRVETPTTWEDTG